MTVADPGGPWQPLSPAEMGVMFEHFPGRWCVAGGWALDLFLDRQTRNHADTDVLVLQSDLAHAHLILPGWELFGASDGQLTAWPAGTELDAGTHDIWCRRDGGPWEFQFMVSEATTTEWIYRRDHRIRGPIDQFIIRSASGLPILAPEIQLLYKSRTPRPKDEQDFQVVLPALSKTQRDWLDSALAIVDPDNPWREELGPTARPATNQQT